jgi:PKD repeat protein
VPGRHVYADAGNYVPTLTVRDSDGVTATIHPAITILDTPISAAAMTLTATEGQTFSGNVATISDTNPLGDPGDFTATIDWGDNSAPSTVSGTSISGSGGSLNVAGSHVYLAEGTYSLAVTINDFGGTSATAKPVATVGDAALAANAIAFTASQSVSQTFHVATFTDTGGAETTANYGASIDWGDGAVTSGASITLDNGVFTVGGTHAYANRGTISPVVTISHGTAPTISVHATAIVVDAPLNVQSATLHANVGVALNEVVATFTDADPNGAVADYTATIDWGDHTSPTIVRGAELTVAAQTFTANASHVYTEAGTYSLTVTVADIGGNVQTESGTAIVVAASVPSATPDTLVLGPTGPYSGSGASTVLANDTSADGQPQFLLANVTSTTTLGSLRLNPDGSFTYAPGTTFQGIDRFSYQVSEAGTLGNTVTDTILSYHASLVDKLYHQVLHRSAEDGGLVFWTAQLDAGKPLDVVATGIFNSTERLNPLVTQFYEQFLGRGTDPGGLAYWVADWQNKGDPRDVVENILASKEFFDDAGDTNLGYINLLYQRVLVRPAEQSGLDYWVGLMGPPSNESRLQIASQFYDTHEKHVDLVDFLFSEYFNGVTPLPDATPYVADLDGAPGVGGQTETQVEKAIIDSTEYNTNPPEPAAGAVGRALYPH